MGKVVRFSVMDAEIFTTNSTMGVAFLPLAQLEKNKKYLIRLPLKTNAPKTDAELGELLRTLKLEKEWIISESTDVSKSFDYKSAEPSAASPTAGSTLVIGVLIKERAKVEEEFWRNLLDEYDEDHSGTINEGEFSHLISQLDIAIDHDKFAAILSSYDSNKDGSLNKEEILKLFADRSVFPAEVLKELYKIIKYGKEGVHRLMLKGATTSVSKDKLEQKEKEKGLSFDANAADSKIDNSGVQILVQDRESGVIIKENIPVYIKAALEILYRTRGGRGLSKRISSVLVSLSKRQGTKMDNPASAKTINSFIKEHKINVDEIELPLNQYKTFNEFFFRKLKAGARICAAPSDPSVATSPADCRMMVFPTLLDSKKWIKGQNFSIENLLTSSYDKSHEFISKFNGASLVIARLAPQDYHRFHYGVSGRVLKRIPVAGDLNTVNPIAIRKEVDVYTNNKRVICPIETKEFGLVIAIAVGATLVGSIRFVQDDAAISKEDVFVKKFDDHGFFAFGGSTVLYLFQPGTIQFSEDLLANSAKQLETLVKVGQAIGKATSSVQQ